MNYSPQLETRSVDTGPPSPRTVYFQMGKDLTLLFHPYFFFTMGRDLTLN